MNRAKQYVNSKPCEVTVHAQKKKKKGRKRGRSKTPGDAQAKHSLNIFL